MPTEVHLSKREQLSNSAMSDRRRFLQTSLAGAAATVVLPALAGARTLEASPPAAGTASFDLDEATIADLQAGMASGKYTARSIAEKYLMRVDAVDKSG